MAEKRSMVYGATRVRFTQVDRAVDEAKKEAQETGEPRYVHQGMADMVVLDYKTAGTVAIVERDGRVVVCHGTAAGKEGKGKAKRKEAGA